MIDKPTKDSEVRALLNLSGKRVIYNKLGLTGVETGRQGLRGEITTVNMKTHPACFVVEWEDGSVQDYSFASLHSTKYWPFAAYKPQIRSYIILEEEFPRAYYHGVPGSAAPRQDQVEEKADDTNNTLDQVISWRVISAKTDAVWGARATQEQAERAAEYFANMNPGVDFLVVAVVSKWSTGEAKRYPQRT